MLDKAAIDADLRRRQQGYGRSPRQQIETDEVEVLAGLRQGRTLGTPLALVVRNRDHKNWTWGMSPWPPEGEPEGKGTKAVTLPRPGHADLAGVQKYGLDDVRDALERASARHTAVHVAAGAVAKALLAEIGIAVAGTALPEAGADPATIDAAREDRDTLGGVVEVRARERAARARLVRAQGGPARRAARRGADGHPGGEGRRDRRRLRARAAARLGGARRDRRATSAASPRDEPRRRHRGRHVERRGDRRPRRDEAAADADEAARARSTSRRASRRSALVERSDVSAVEALAVVAEAAVAWELARAAREKFGGDALGDFVAALAYRDGTLRDAGSTGRRSVGEADDRARNGV